MKRTGSKPIRLVQGSGFRVRGSELGFTLMELLVVSGILLVLGGGLLTTFLTGQTSYLSADAYIQVQQEARKAFDNVVRELREAGPPLADPDPNFMTRTSPNSPAGCIADAQGVPCNQLNFQIAIGYNRTDLAGCPAGQICWGDTQPGRWVHYAVVSAGANNLQLVRCVNTDQNGQVTGQANCADGYRVLANNIRTATFVLDNPADPKAVTSNLQIRYSNPRLPGGNQQTGILSSSVRLRNAT